MLPKSNRKAFSELPINKAGGYFSSTLKSITCTKLYLRFLPGILFLLLSLNSYAQFDPRINCTNGCTSNDVQIKTAYLVQPTSPFNPLPSSYQCQGTASVKLALDLTTKTPRVGVYIYAKVINKNTNAVIASVSECFSTALASGGVTKVVFNQTINWPCGTPIVLTEVFIGWGTGNTDFCGGSSAERCPATPSKCYSLPPGEYITIQIPSAIPASATACSDAPGGTTATFNLTALNSTVSGGAAGVTVTWFSNEALTNSIGTPGAYVSGTGSVWAKVSNNLDPTAFQKAEVSLTVNRTPVANAASATLCSSSPGGTQASFDLTALEATVKGGQANVAVSWFSDAGLTNSISSPYATASTTVYAKIVNTNATSCFSSVGVSLTVNRTPTATTTSDTRCSTTEGGTTAVFDLTSLEAAVINGQSNVSVTWFTNSDLTSAVATPAAYQSATGTVYAQVTNSNATSCSSSVGVSLTVTSRPSALTASVTAPTCGVPTGTITVTSDKTGLTFSINSTNPADFTNVSGVFPNLAPGDYIIRAKNAGGCISDGLQKTVGSIPDATPAADVVIITSPSCSSSTGSLKVVKASDKSEYDNTVFEFSNDGGSTWTNNPVFSFVAGGGYNITVRRISDNTCTASTSCQAEQAPVQNSAAPTAGRVLEENIRIEKPDIGVKTYPNPFSDRVRFNVTVEQAGQGSLDVFNMQGQKVKTVYSGYVPAGTSFYELQLPTQSSGQLIYIFRIGDQKITGRLMQMTNR